MPHYRLSCQNPLSGFLQVQTFLENLTQPELFLQLPAWRPGRYELQNFAQKLQGFSVVAPDGSPLPVRKETKDRWRVDIQGNPRIEVRYNFYARQMDAGGSWVAPDFLYVNPVNCLLTASGLEQEPCTLALDIPDHWQIACGLPTTAAQTLQAENFDHLADSPFITSATLQHQAYEEQGHLFHVWFQGACQPDWEQILPHFRAFTRAQLALFETFPVKDYHFLNIILPYQHYHGVEHLNSTVITLGPAEQLMSPTLYKELLGVSCHELFHTWNIKQIRPQEMLPYDFTRENYFRTGYVAEGVTTYYGDYLLARSGVFTADQYFQELNTVLKRHTVDQGEQHLSVADSSFDTWLDGYKPGVPDRKVSIYHKGCLAALVLDLEIRRTTQNARSLDDVMRRMWQEFGQPGLGYTEADYQRLAEEEAGQSLEPYFREMIFGTASFEPWLQAALDYVGCTLHKEPAALAYESVYGFRLNPALPTIPVVGYVVPDSPAAAVLSVDDELVAVNGRKLENGNLQHLTKGQQKLEVTLFRQKTLQTVTLSPGPQLFLPQYSVRKNPSATAEQQENFRQWLHQEFREPVKVQAATVV
ncbi:M61 family metallopeptidase [Rufibacter glacialis]|uniref:M61 family metallopeptidase n=1 Tax=Rufibacter glacialis TaxID=1259555 RepID=A0A5M8Q8K6_9BACT|nr:M61 family metallopeptidase [Rufibacter glacialis]KAA6431196.1 M61 family metallopeptidase [Rufibacter glacialis]GGK84873.1 peptidase M61 [Rufibacter glacialis]